MQTFLIRLLLGTMGIALVLGVLEFFAITHMGGIAWGALAFFAIMTYFLTSREVNAKDKSNSRFVSSSMGIMGIRMFLCVIFVMVYWLVAGKRDYMFIVYFFILYLFFTMFEIVYLIYKLRADKKDGQDSKTN